MNRRAASLLTCIIVVTACSGGRASQVPPTTTAPPSGAPPTVAAAQLADPGLPSQVGHAPLAGPTLQTLVQYLEDRVADAYARSDPDALYRYLAGSMLTGNRATIKLLTSRHQRNVFAIKVASVTVDTTDANRIVADITAQMTTNQFVDTTTNQTLAGGPGGAALRFTIFLDFNPTNHTWYWTGQRAIP